MSRCSCGRRCCDPPPPPQSVKMVLESQEHLDHAAGVVLRMLMHMDENNDGQISYKEFMVRRSGCCLPARNRALADFGASCTHGLACAETRNSVALRHGHPERHLRRAARPRLVHAHQPPPEGGCDGAAAPPKVRRGACLGDTVRCADGASVGVWRATHLPHTPPSYAQSGQAPQCQPPSGSRGAKRTPLVVHHRTRRRGITV